MNNKGQLFFVYIMVFFLLAITAFALIEPFKDSLDRNRGYASSGLNCPNTADFNVTSYNNQSTGDKVIYRPVCFVTGLSMAWFVSAILLTGVTWVYNNWRKGK